MVYAEELYSFYIFAKLFTFLILIRWKITNGVNLNHICSGLCSHGIDIGLIWWYSLSSVRLRYWENMKKSLNTTLRLFKCYLWIFGWLTGSFSAQILLCEKCKIPIHWKLKSFSNSFYRRFLTFLNIVWQFYCHPNSTCLDLLHVMKKSFFKNGIDRLSREMEAYSRNVFK